jgi:hypothetical protein
MTSVAEPELHQNDAAPQHCNTATLTHEKCTSYALV